MNNWIAKGMAAIRRSRPTPIQVNQKRGCRKADALKEVGSVFTGRGSSGIWRHYALASSILEKFRSQGAQKSLETIAHYFIGDGAISDKHSSTRTHVVRNRNDINHEDIGIIELIQDGRRSEGFGGGVLSPYWAPLQQYFARLLSNSIAAKSNSNSKS